MNVLRTGGGRWAVRSIVTRRSPQGIGRAARSSTHAGATQRSHYAKAAFAGGVVTAVMLGVAFVPMGMVLLSEEKSDKTKIMFTKAEVAKKNNKKDGIWVTHKDGVYDVTAFVDIHPGGDRILQAAGKSVDPFWALYQQHLTEDVLEILEEYRIGTLSDYKPDEKAALLDEYRNDPTDRLSALPVYTEAPFNAGTIEVLIPENYITPTPLTYIRNHHPVPKIEEEAYRLKLGWGIELSLEDLKTKFPAKEIVATMVCAGNRRDEFNTVEPVQGLRWKSDAVSTSRWKGVLLKDLQALIQVDPKKEAHVWFMGEDEPYDASIPIEKAFSPEGDVLIAYEMNGMPIPRDHGGPVRVVVPGHVAARSVKWLKQITAADCESLSPWQRGGAYKSFGPSQKTLTNVDFEKYPSIQEMPVQSAIAKYEIIDNAKAVRMKGWAWSGGGRKIIRIEVSVDGGKNWEEVKPGMGADQPFGRAWAWTFWSHTMELPRDLDGVELVVRAVDESFNVQPETPKATWNLRGVLNNCYHRVRISIGENGQHGGSASP